MVTWRLATKFVSTTLAFDGFLQTPSKRHEFHEKMMKADTMSIFMIVLMMAVFLAYQRLADQKIRRLQERAGTAILKIGCPLSRSMLFWGAFPFSLLLFTNGLFKLSNRASGDVIPGILGLGSAVFVVVATALRVHRGDVAIDAILTQHGVVIGDGEDLEGDFVAWGAITKWTWSHTPGLHLNLYDGHQVRSIPVPEVLKLQVESVVERETARPRSSS